MVIIRPLGLQWIRGPADDPTDLCAHGDVEFRIDNDVLLYTTGTDFTVSAAALYLLRTLSAPHTKAAPVGDHLFPCCGYDMRENPDQEDVEISGCPDGVDFEVLHAVDGVGVIVRSADGREWRVGWPEWRAAVFAFADRVSEFYAECSPKQLLEDDVEVFGKFKNEWARRRGVG